MKEFQFLLVFVLSLLFFYGLFLSFENFRLEEDFSFCPYGFDGFVYRITVENPGLGSGTAFAYKALDGKVFFITNRHVVYTNDFLSGEEKRREILRLSPDNDGFFSPDGFYVEYFFSNEDYDFAILYVNTDETDNFLFFEQADRFIIGEKVFSVGFPDRTLTLNGGRILEKRKEPHREFFSSSISSYFGASGSPVMNDDLEIVGMIFAAINIERNGEYSKTSLFTPINIINEFFEEELKKAN